MNLQPLPAGGRGQGRMEATRDDPLPVLPVHHRRQEPQAGQVHAPLPQLQEQGAKHVTEGAIEGVEDEVEPDSPTVRKALKGVAAGAAAAGVAAAAKKLADRAGSDDER